MPTCLNHWPSGARDTTEFPKVSLQFDVTLREHLDAFCKMDGVGWTDYDAQRDKSGLEASGSRLRTYRKMYEKFGLIYKENEIIKLSRLGQQIASLSTDLETQKDNILNRLRITAIDILSRYQLRNPSENYTLPEDCDILPSIVIWKAMVELDGKLHPEEINRVILRVMRMDEIGAAIERIRQARARCDNYASVSSQELEDVLGEPVHVDQAPARIAPWFSFVGWGGLIIEQNVDADGYRNLTEASIPMINKILDNPPSFYAATDEEDWLQYYIGSASQAPEEDHMPNIEMLIDTDPLPEDLSLEELGAILKQMYEDPNTSSQTNATRMFAIKYGAIIEKHGYNAAMLVAAAGLKDSYQIEVNKGINIYRSIKTNEYGVRFYEPNPEDETEGIQIEPPFFPRTSKLHPLNSILYGAPGTGKTYITAEYALAILENREVDESPKTTEQRKAVMEQYRNYVDAERIVFTTFHQSYGYEDFIQGLRPVSKNSGTDFVPVDGVFKRIADNAKYHPENNYVIIIDEINRANISKVFGELITLIEDDKRWGEVNALQVTLPSGQPFKIPNNLYIVGTMNSADKSISLIDTALRRRFEFIEVTPNASLIADPVLRSVLEKLNASLAKELDSTDLLVGHAYFIGKTEDELCSIFNRSIIPLLYEYFYDNSTKVKAQIKNALPNDQYEITGGTVGRIKISKK